MYKSVSLIFCCLLCIFSFLISENVHAEESTLPEAPIYIDNKPVTTKFLMRNDHILVPALFFKNTGFLVDWDNEYRSVVFQGKGKRFALPVGKKFTDDYVQGAWKRGKLSTETIEFKNEVFVPLVDVAEKMGMHVTYNPQQNRTFITTNYYVKPNAVEQGNTKEKLVALTFDDGPDYYYTPLILDILKEKGVPATFFIMGKQAKVLPDLMRRMVREGHGIGNHTMNHPDLRKQWSSKVREEILSTQQVLQNIIGRSPDLFRPPYGAITKADQVILNEIGMRNIMWSVDTLDWSGASADQILEIVHRDISPGKIILQHNFQDGRLLNGTIGALPKIIDDLQKQGYQFVTVQTLLSK